MRKAKISVIVLFVGTLAFSFFLSVLFPQKEFSATENRPLEQRPELCVEDILSGDFQETYENYLNDQFPGRDRWVNLAVGTDRLLGQKDVNKIYLGKDGYLLEKYSDGDFDERQSEDNIGILGEFLNRMTEQYGKEHVDCFFVPGKAAALSKKLPKFVEPYDEQEIISAVLDELEEPEVLTDLTDIMQKHENEYIYYRTDHHWTTLGAYYAYEAWCEKKKEVPVSLSSYQREVVSNSFYGTSYNKSHQRVKKDTIELFHGPVESGGIHVDWDDGEEEADSWYWKDALRTHDQYQVFFNGNTAKITVDTGNKNGKTLLLLKDSYSNCFVPFLAEHYNRIIMIDLRYCSDCIDDIMEEYPDISDVMVMYNVEKFQQDDHMELLAEY